MDWGASSMATIGKYRSSHIVAHHSPIVPLRKICTVAGMSTTLLYGIILAVGNILLTLVGFFLGFQTEKINDGTWFGFFPFILSVVVLWLGIRAVREENENKALTYGKGVGSGMMIALYAGIIGAIYVYAHFSFINPNFPDYLIEASRPKWAAIGMPDASMEAAEKAIRMFTKPGLQAATSFAFSMIASLIVSLITAAFLKQSPAQTSTETLN